MMNKLNFTEFSADDAAELAALDKECFSQPWSEDAFLKDSKNPLAQYVIAKIDSKIIGYGGFWAVVDEGQITNIAVSEKMRRHGIGKKILGELIKKAKDKNLNRLTLEVRQSNLSAISLYSGLNFTKTGLRKNYYKNPTENAVLMDLEI